MIETRNRINKMLDKNKRKIEIGDYVILYDYYYGMVYDFIKTDAGNVARVKTDKAGVFSAYSEDIKVLRDKK